MPYPVLWEKLYFAEGLGKCRVQQLKKHFIPTSLPLIYVFIADESMFRNLFNASGAMLVTPTASDWEEEKRPSTNSTYPNNNL